MPTDKAARTRYPKSYIIERIDARVVSLNSKIDVGVAAENAFAETERAALLQWLMDSGVYYERQLRTVRNLLQDKPNDLKQQAYEFYNDRSDSAPSWPLAGYRGQIVIPDDVADYRRRRSQWVNEIASLEHAKAYLQDTPVDEFSLHGLRELKLLEVIQFNILTAKEK